MTTLPHTPELMAVAQRVVWFRPPAEALEDGIHFLAHVMTYGTPGISALWKVLQGRMTFGKYWPLRRPAYSIRVPGLTGTCCMARRPLRRCPLVNYLSQLGCYRLDNGLFLKTLA
jgi:hypothetical protein